MTDMSGNLEKVLQQKEYLKKYLSKETKKKKKKKKVSSSSFLKPSQIIDDDIDLNKIGSINDDDYDLEDYMGEDAPQVVGIIDERPRHLKVKDFYDKRHWKDVGENDDSENSNPDESEFQQDNKSIKENNREINSQTHSTENIDSFANKKNINLKDQDSESDDSLHREILKNSKESLQKNKTKTTNNDFSPERRKRERDNSIDLSPSRYKEKKNRRSKSSNLSPVRRGDKRKSKENDDRDSDLSVERERIGNKTRRRGSSNDTSPPRSKDYYRSRSRDHWRHDRRYRYTSPPSGRYKGNWRNRSRRDSSSSEQRRREIRNSRKSVESDIELPSVVRKRKEEEERKKETNIHNKQEEKDSKQGKRIKKNNDAEESIKKTSNRDDKLKNDSDSDLEVPRKDDLRRKDKVVSEKRLEKTLDGKKAGLQDAKDLRNELNTIRQREEEAFDKMDQNLLGKNAAPIVRNAGRYRNKQQLNPEETLEKAKKEAERLEKYERWGRGLKQIQAAEEKSASMSQEMSKPLARYANDESLEKMLKDRLRDGDPMLEYIRKKQTEAHPINISQNVEYAGSFMPNRFGIRPGHRWDGVDRSNGYEKRWFEVQNSKIALEEEAWKWSSTDM